MSGIAVRVVASLGYRPALWFWADSFSYLSSALDMRPLESRPSGYSVFLAPFHSVLALITVQHLLGLGIAVCVYAVLRKRTFLPAWAAGLATAPILLDAYQIQLEHLVMADLLFTFLVVAGVTLLLLNPRSWFMVTLGFLLLAFSATTRTLGLPLIGVAAVWLLIARAGWQRVVAGLGVAGVAVAGYAVWYNAAYGSYGLGSSSVWLWSRTMTFADCSRMEPPDHLKVLCPDIGPRLAAPAYIWDATLTHHEDRQAARRTGVGVLDARAAVPAARLPDGRARRRDVGLPLGPGGLPVAGHPERLPVPRLRETAHRQARLGRAVGPEPMTQYQGSRADTRDRRAVRVLDARLPAARLPARPDPGGDLRCALLVMIIRFRVATLLPLGFALTLLLLPPLVAAFDHRYVVPVVPPRLPRRGLRGGLAVTRGERAA